MVDVSPEFEQTCQDEVRKSIHAVCSGVSETEIKGRPFNNDKKMVKMVQHMYVDSCGEVNISGLGDVLRNELERCEFNTGIYWIQWGRGPHRTFGLTTVLTVVFYLWKDD